MSPETDAEYKPYEEEDDTEDDLYFTNSEDELDPAVSGFQDVNVVNEKSRTVKKKGVVTNNFEDEDGARSDELYLRCYEAVIHPLNGPDLWERTAHPDVMPPPYKRPSHRPVKKRKPATGDEEHSSHTHMSRKGEKQRCSICGSVGHNKSRCPKPIEDEAQTSKKLSKGKQKKGSNNSQPPAVRGEEDCIYTAHS
ncbi:hypothetical protein Ahy_B06g084710 [Arachis hypogaea]|uniref:CCHC-type domain-containing protein n=1 Tax=Arachis hypogaea TaxID=3818 RepID=A0A444YSL2_ARAHY|nr:hypothetical protein Ahy_B06g084710 [Arachis hypogaea]